ncbi:traF protein [Salmonella enterica subsp. enterica serovar Give]|nr:traF protein [Salmonella enterica subsp. salamae]EAU2345884.1 traF protein [Salmonella enterica]EBZ2217484.1 traF protein [Salmonella enterica subsp. enterica serovar Montevideo]ECA5182804.1 traF protein [Salmonella enterica subsp. enterica serovar Newport]ECD3769235.1 traF protein [Salmonella enterica subsp. enterica serovar Onderstepoort]ECI2685734.1 traF protein [Salmonella enterica subsp. enterica]ECI2791945.1 traF protein [Salmonella enterica subsp. enterica serovar Give]EDA8242612.1
MRATIALLLICFLSSCSSPPQPKQSKGGWYELNTTIQDVKTRTI